MSPSVTNPTATGHGGGRAAFQLVYIGGMGRSGSTVIERLLGELPGVCSVGEVVHLWQRGLVDGESCGCGEPFSLCPFWRDVGQEAFGGWSQVAAQDVLSLKVSVDRLRFLPALLRSNLPTGLGSGVERYTGLYNRLYAAAAKVSGCPTVVDASKHASLAACLRHRYGRNLRVVHVVRDPRAVAHSWGKRRARPMATSTSVEQEMARYSPGRAAVQWNAENAALAGLARRGVPTLRVRYEDFVASPLDTFGRIAAFAGHHGDLPLGPDHTARLSPTHALSGNPLWSTSNTLTIAADTSWQTHLRTRNRVLVSLLTTPIRRRLGY